MYEQAHEHPCVFICMHVQKTPGVLKFINIQNAYDDLEEDFLFLPFFFHVQIAIKLFFRFAGCPFLLLSLFLFFFSSAYCIKINSESMKTR